MYKTLTDNVFLENCITDFLDLLQNLDDGEGSNNVFNNWTRKFKAKLRLSSEGQTLILKLDEQLTSMRSTTVKEYLHAVVDIFVAPWPAHFQKAKIILNRWGMLRSSMRTVLDLQFAAADSGTIRNIFNESRLKKEKGNSTFNLGDLSDQAKQICIKARAKNDKLECFIVFKPKFLASLAEILVVHKKVKIFYNILGRDE